VGGRKYLVDAHSILLNCSSFVLVVIVAFLRALFEDSADGYFTTISFVLLQTAIEGIFDIPFMSSTERHISQALCFLPTLCMFAGLMFKSRKKSKTPE
jgi:hypothetical protein